MTLNIQLTLLTELQTYGHDKNASVRRYQLILISI